MEAIKLGTLVVRGCPVKIPDNPRWKGDTFGCNSVDIEIANSMPGKEIRWIPLDHERFDLPKDRQIYICDRVILIVVSWDTLDEAGFVEGKRTTIDGKDCIVRLMTGVDEDENCGPGCATEWDMMMDQYGADDDITHWKGLYTWCREMFLDCRTNRWIRGDTGAYDEGNVHKCVDDEGIGFRPVLEVLTEKKTE